jgi:hypothetical protein
MSLTGLVFTFLFFIYSPCTALATLALENEFNGKFRLDCEMKKFGVTDD